MLREQSSAWWAVKSISWPSGLGRCSRSPRPSSDGSPPVWVFGVYTVGLASAFRPNEVIHTPPGTAFVYCSADSVDRLLVLPISKKLSSAAEAPTLLERA